MLGMPVPLKVRHIVEVSFALTVQQHLWKLLNKSLTQGQLYTFQSSDDFIWPHPLRWQCPCMRQWLVNPSYFDWMVTNEWWQSWYYSEMRKQGSSERQRLLCYLHLPRRHKDLWPNHNRCCEWVWTRGCFPHSFTKRCIARFNNETLKRGSNDHSTHGEKEGLISTLHFSCCHFLWSCSN